MHWRTHIGRHGTTFLPGETWAQRTFFVLLALAAVLRFWDLPHLPYTHDEISGLLRVGYPTFGQLIRDGVAVDAHPPGVAVFLHYWTMLFGFGEAAVKTPFILVSLAALFLLYRFTTAWSNSTVALLIMALLATLQYTVLYAQIARPYAAGFFTCALLTDQWTRWLAGGPNARRALTGFALALALGAYMHHFALLFGAIVGVTGLFLTERARLKPYLLALLAAAVLYLPNVPIFLKQLGYGGVGQWLAPPDRYWVGDHLAWVVHYGAVMAALLMALGGWALVRRWQGLGRGPAVRMALVWWLLPLAIGLAYSAWINPVLQHSVLLFSFPYLLLALLHGLPELRPRSTVLLCTAVSILGLHGLVNERQHFALFNTSKYEAIIKAGQDAIAEHGAANVQVLVDAPDEAIAFLLRIRRIDPAAFPHVQLRHPDFRPALLDSVLLASTGKVIVYGYSNGAPPETPARIQERFSRLLARHDLLEGQVLVFADRPLNKATRPDRWLVAQALPGGERSGNWEIHDDLPTLLDSTGQAVWNYGDREFGVLVGLLTDTVATHPQDNFEVVAQLRSPPGTINVGLVVELKAADSTVFYRTGELDATAVVDGRATLVVTAHPADARLRNTPLELRAYLYNREKAPLLLEGMAVYRRRANPFQYGLFERSWYAKGNGSDPGVRPK